MRISVQHEVQLIDNFGSKRGSSFDAGRLVETFTAANGRGVKITFDAGHEENAALLNNPDGTTTQVFTFAGLNALTQAVGGPVLEQGSGRVGVTEVFDATGNLVSFNALAGPNPNLTGEPDCSVVGPTSQAPDADDRRLQDLRVLADATGAGGRWFEPSTAHLAPIKPCSGWLCRCRLAVMGRGYGIAMPWLAKALLLALKTKRGRELLFAAGIALAEHCAKQAST